MAPIRLAVIGGGKVSERFHLPVAHASDRFDLRVLVDRDLPRARSLAQTYGIPVVTDRIDELPGQVDAAIVATPHHLHASIATALLDQGVHVLVEKPMALDVTGCDAMIASAEAHDVVLAVGLLRRFYPSSRFVRELVAEGVLGNMVGVDAREGAIFNWQVASDATFRREMGGGVLTDIGTHVLDLLLWWLGEPDRVSYSDDAMGGVEADAELEATFPGGVTGIVELSRTRVLRNTITLQAAQGRIEVGPAFDSELRLALTGRARLAGRVDDRDRASRLEDVFAVQLADFAGAIDDGRPPFVPGLEGRRSIALLETCRQVRRPLDLPWVKPRPSMPDAGVTP
jgi:predicted dehydrogenase